MPQTTKKRRRDELLPNVLNTTEQKHIRTMVALNDYVRHLGKTVVSDLLPQLQGWASTINFSTLDDKNQYYDMFRISDDDKLLDLTKLMDWLDAEGTPFSEICKVIKYLGTNSAGNEFQKSPGMQLAKDDDDYELLNTAMEQWKLLYHIMEVIQ